MRPLESLLRAFVELHPEDAARAFEALDSRDATRLFRNLPNRVVVELLRRLSPQVSGPLVGRLEPDRVRQLMEAMGLRPATSLLRQLESEQREAVLAALPKDRADALRDLSDYPADTAGGLMEPKVLSIAIDLTAKQAISKVRKAPRETLHYLYVVARDGKLVGVINMRDLLLASPGDPIEPLVQREVFSIPDTMGRDEVVNIMRERRFLALPVVDIEGRLLGVVKHGAILTASQIEGFADLQKIVGAGADERALSPVSTVVKSRLPWLYVNLMTAFLAAAVVGLFEGIISEIAALAVLLPVVAGQGGNTGSQSLAVVMRGLALREIIHGVKKRVILKETLGGLINGIAVAVVTAVLVFAWRLLSSEPLIACFGLSLVIGLAMTVNMVAAALSGAIIPLILKALGRDPAQSAAIFLTTVTDIVGFASFLGLAALFSSMLLPAA